LARIDAARPLGYLLNEGRDRGCRYQRWGSERQDQAVAPALPHAQQPQGDVPVWPRAVPV
jgi:hypothetical protein